MSVGDRVTVNDYSEAHGDTGTIDYIQSDGLIHVLLDNGVIWPCEERDLWPADNPHNAAGD